MLNKSQICNQIFTLYPDMGQCGRDLKVNWDEKNSAWAVDFNLKGQKIRHYLEDEDATACVIGRKCVALGIEFGQFH